MGRLRSTVAVLCALVVAGCTAGGAADPPGPAAQITGFEVHASPEAAPVEDLVPSAPQRSTAGCLMVRQGTATGQRACLPRREVCARGAIWWTPDLNRICPAPRPVPVRIVSAPDELPVGAAMCVVWSGTPSAVREGIVVAASPHANCVTGIVGTVSGPPAEPLATVFPAHRPDCGVHFPGTRRAYVAKVEFVEAPASAWACLIG